MPNLGGNTFIPRCVHLVRFDDLELRDAFGTVQAIPAPVDFFDCLTYYKTERVSYTGRAQSVDLDGRVTAEGYFQEGCPVGLWTRWYDNGQKREEFFITEGECASEQRWNEDGVPI